MHNSYKALLSVAIGLTPVAHGHCEARLLKIEQGTIDNVVSFSRLRIPLERYAMAISGTRSNSFDEATLEHAGRKPADQRPASFAILSAGFSRNDPQEPSGGLIEERSSYSPFSLRNTGALTGVLCIDHQGKPRLYSIAEFQITRKLCSSAVQAGPIVVEPDGSAAINTEESDSAARLVACAPIERRDSFDFYYFRRITLPAVESALRSRCSIALNLTGSIQAGMTVWDAGRMVEAAGRTNTPLPSMIFVYAR